MNNQSDDKGFRAVEGRLIAVIGDEVNLKWNWIKFLLAYLI